MCLGYSKARSIVFQKHPSPPPSFSPSPHAYVHSCIHSCQHTLPMPSPMLGGAGDTVMIKTAPVLPSVHSGAHTSICVCGTGLSPHNDDPERSVLGWRSLGAGRAQGDTSFSLRGREGFLEERMAETWSRSRNEAESGVEWGGVRCTMQCKQHMQRLTHHQGALRKLQNPGRAGRPNGRGRVAGEMGGIVWFGVLLGQGLGDGGSGVVQTP